MMLNFGNFRMNISTSNDTLKQFHKMINTFQGKSTYDTNILFNIFVNKITIKSYYKNYFLRETRRDIYVSVTKK